MKSLGVTSVLLPTLVLASLSACEAPARQVLQPDELCSDNPNTAIATFEDANLEAWIRSRLGLDAQDDLTCGLLSGLMAGGDRDLGIVSLAGIQNLTSVVRLVLGDNAITDINALSGLTSLTTLGLQNNSITDIGALSGLTSLTTLVLDNNAITDINVLSGLTSLTGLALGSNAITDISALSGLTGLRGLVLDGNPDLNNIQPLLNNIGLGADDTVHLTSANVSCTDVAALEAKGVEVTSDCG